MRGHSHPGDRRLAGGIAVIFDDADLIVVDKPSGMLSVPTPRESGISALEILEDFIRKGQAKSRKKLFPVNRLDKFTSGILIFAKTMEMREKMHVDWAGQTLKTYVAVVNGRMRELSGRVESNLIEEPSMMVRSTGDPTWGKPAVTEWNVLRAGERRSLLEIHPLTGRKNQIRVQMADIGHPIVGDRKYGGGDGNGRLALHAWKIALPHPRDNRPMEFESPIPAEITRLTGSD